MDKIPSEFLKLAEQTHQDVHLIFPSIDEFLRSYLSGISSDERLQIKSFLFSVRDSGQSFAEIWAHTRSDFFLKNENNAELLMDEIIRQIDLMS